MTYRGLVSVGLDLHSTGNSGDGLLSRQIGNVNESVVESGIYISWESFLLLRMKQDSRGKDVGDTKDELTLLDLRSKRDGWGVFGPDLLGGLE